MYWATESLVHMHVFIMPYTSSLICWLWYTLLISFTETWVTFVLATVGLEDAAFG